MVELWLVVEPQVNKHIQVISGLGNPHKLCGPSLLSPFEHVERFRNLKFAVITRGSFSYGYVPTWCSNPTLSKIFLDTKILPCLKYQHEKHTLHKISAFGSFCEEDIQLLRRIQILYRIHCMQN